MLLRNSIRILIISLALGCAFDLLFYGKQSGLSILIFTSLLTLALFVILRIENTAVKKGNLWIFGILFLFASMVFIRANTFLTVLNISAVLVVIALLSASLVRKPIVDMRISDQLIAPVQACLMSFVQASKIVALISKHSRSSSPVRDSKRTAPILRGVLLTVPVMFVFIPL